MLIWHSTSTLEQKVLNFPTYTTIKIVSREKKFVLQLALEEADREELDLYLGQEKASAEVSDSGQDIASGR